MLGIFSQFWYDGKFKGVTRFDANHWVLHIYEGDMEHILKYVLMLMLVYVTFVEPCYINHDQMNIKMITTL